MEIEHLKEYSNNPNLKNSTVRGLSIVQIEILELELNNGKEFPKAFREFLFIGGDYCGLELEFVLIV